MTRRSAQALKRMPVKYLYVDLKNLLIAGIAVAVFWSIAWAADLKLAAALPEVRAADGFPYFRLESSVRYVLFWQEDVDNIGRGDWVQLQGISDPRIAGSKNLVKRAVCVAGDNLMVLGNDYLCRHNGKTDYLGAALERDSANRPLFRFAPWTASGTARLSVDIVPPGKLFVIGDHRKSYDSRYFGYVDEEKNVRYKLRPLL